MKSGCISGEPPVISSVSSGCFLMKRIKVDNTLGYFCPETTEVIGNIYENPELLEVKDEK